MWRYAHASVIGSSHEKSNSPLQDSHSCEVVMERGGSEVLIAVVSDGAGSAPRSQEGSTLVCIKFADSVNQLLQGGFNIDETLMKKAQAICRDAVFAKAKNDEVSISEFACTLIGAVVCENQALMVQVGDGAIVYSTEDRPGEYQLSQWPAKGEYENTTYFLTDPQEKLEKTIKYGHIPYTISKIALFTDGIERLSLNFKTQKPFAPFFDAMFRPLEEDDHSEEVSPRLEQFLNSPNVNSRTDDDKSLILAVRKSSSLSSNETRHSVL